MSTEESRVIAAPKWSDVFGNSKAYFRICFFFQLESAWSLNSVLPVFARKDLADDDEVTRHSDPAAPRLK